MSFSFNVNKITPASLDIPSFNFNITTITPKPIEPVEIMTLKDSNGGYLQDSNNNKLFVRR